jgi:hypothetical protein
MQELRESQNREFSRPKRTKKLKEYTWSSGSFHKTKSWKDCRKKQYRNEKRGERHELNFNICCWRQQWNLELYLKNHNIPYRVEHIREIERRKRTITTRIIKDRQVPVYNFKYEWLRRSDGTKYCAKVLKHQVGYSWVYRDVPLDKPVVKWYYVSRLTGYKVVWWSDKNIGIEYVLNKQ